MAGPMNPYDAEPGPQGMSGTTKVLLAFGIGCGILLVLCCGVFGIVGYWGANYFQDSVSDDPVKAREITDSIARIEVPEGLEPQGSIDLRVPFQGDRIMRGALYASDEGDNHLIIGDFNEEFGDADIEGQFRQSMRESRGKDHEELNILESEDYDTEINGAEASFRISKAEGRRSKKPYWQVVGEFRGEDGPGILVVRLEADTYSKDDVMNIIKSMEDEPGEGGKAEAEAPAEEAPADDARAKDEVPAGVE